MVGPSNKLVASLTELRRRSVFRVGAWYAVAAFGALQLMSAIAEPLGLGVGGMRLVIFAILAGFPLALFLAWAFDLGPGGLRRDTRTGADSPRWLELSIIAALTAAVGALGYTLYRPDAGFGSAVADKSIAVLPFVNMSGDAANDYFGEGLAEELLNLLAKVPDLRVAARTSSFAYKGRNEDVRRIGNELNVATVLEGSVRKSGERLRITAQLINVADGYHLWSETYDRELDDIFKIQDDIATSIAQQLKVRLLGAATDARGTQDVAAYDLYLLGRHRWRERTEADLLAAADYFERAIAADPGFARAYSGLADAKLLLADHGDLPQAEALAAAEPLAERALALDANLAEAHASLGLIRFNQNRLDEAVAEYRRAIELDASYPYAHLWLGNALNEPDRKPERLAAYQRALELDPLLLPANMNLADQYMRIGRFREAVQLYERLSRLQADRASFWYARIGEALRQGGALAESVQWQRRALEADPWNVEAAARIAHAYVDLGDHAQAARWVEIARRIDPEHPLAAFAQLMALGGGDDPRAFDTIDRYVKKLGAANSPEVASWRVITAVMTGRRDAAALAAGLEQLFGGRLPTAEFTATVLPYAAWARRQGENGRGDSAGATRMVDAGREFLVAERAAGSERPDFLYAGAQLAALAGDRAAGIALLQEALRAGYSMTWILRKDPTIELLRGDPAFEPILQATEAGLAQQRQVLAAAALPDFTPPTHPQPVSLPSARLDGLVGFYSGANLGGQLLEVRREGEALFAVDGPQRQRFRLYAVDAERFFDAETATRYEFRRGADDRATGLVRWRAGFPLRAKRVAWDPPVAGRADPARYGDYVGEYLVDKTRSVRVWTADGRLWGQQTNEPQVEALPEREDQFFLAVAPVRLRFERDAGGKVVAMRVIQPDQEILLQRAR